MTADQQDMFNRNVMLALIELRDLAFDIKKNPQERASVRANLNERLDLLSKAITGVDQRDRRLKEPSEALEIETKCFIAQIISGHPCTHPRKHEEARAEVVRSA